MKLDSLVPVPSRDAMNTGLHAAGTLHMLSLLGVPGKPTRNCSSVTNAKLRARLTTRDVGPFSVTGLEPAVASLARIFAEVRVKEPEVYAQVKTAGMTCCRLIRGAKATYSIHSWGAAIDLYFGAGVAPLGQKVTHMGVLKLYKYFHEEGWYWGAAFGRCDAMHFEVARETLREWRRKGWI